VKTDGLKKKEKELYLDKLENFNQNFHWCFRRDPCGTGDPRFIGDHLSLGPIKLMPSDLMEPLKSNMNHKMLLISCPL